VSLISRRQAANRFAGSWIRGPAQQAKLAELPDRVIEIRVGAFDRLVRRADLLPARHLSVRVGHSRVRSEGVQHDLLDAVGLDRRPSRAPLRARVTAAVVAAVAVDHHPRPARPAAQHTEPRQKPL
jgi:hypothetical protein